MSRSPSPRIPSAGYCARGKKKNEAVAQAQPPDAFALGWNNPFPHSPGSVVLSVSRGCRRSTAACDACEPVACLWVCFPFTLDDGCALVYAFALRRSEHF